MNISWAAVTNAASYNVYRNGSKANALAVTATSFTDSGLAAATQYSWAVKAVDVNSAESAASASVLGTTSGTAPPPPAATCYTASNYAHTTAGRAYVAGGYAFAYGSNQNMGLWNIYIIKTLKLTAPNYYVIGTCP